MLLDPASIADPELLTFSDNGEPACAKPDDPIAVSRVKTTVPIYGLDSDILCEARREKWRGCSSKLKKFQRIVEEKRHQDNDDAAEC